MDKHKEYDDRHLFEIIPIWLPAILLVIAVICGLTMGWELANFYSWLKGW